MGGLAAPCCDKMLVVYNLQCIFFFFSLQGYFVFMCPKIIKKNIGILVPNVLFFLVDV